MLSTTGRVFSLQRSNGGVPKTLIGEAVVSEDGLEGDKQRDRRNHGGPERALCLFSLEEIVALQAEGHPIYPGSTGENVTITGLDWPALRIGACLQLGDDVLIQLTSYTVPCKNIAASFQAGDFTRISPKVYPSQTRLYARVLRGGVLRVGHVVTLVECPRAAAIEDAAPRY